MTNTILTSLITIIEVVIILGLLIFFHELGHFLAARAVKIGVEEFGFGYPPRMLKLFRVWGTDVTLNWIPFGGFVRLRGDNNPGIADGMLAASPWKRLLVYISGPLMNLAIGILLFSILFSSLGAPDTSKVLISQVNENSPAQTIGMQAGDLFVSINETPIDSMETLSTLVKDNIGEEISITYQREEQDYSVKAIPRVNPPEGEGALGIVMTNPTVAIPFLNAVPMASVVAYQQTVMLVTLPIQLIEKRISPEDARIIGPIGMVTLYQNANTLDAENAQQQESEIPPFANTLGLTATISIAFFITNLLIPFPALDGGRILLTLPELIFRRRLPITFENMLNLVGFVLLILIMFYVTTQDIFNPVQIP